MPWSNIRWIICQSHTLLTLGSNPTNSNPRQSMVTSGKNWPLASALYAWGSDEASNFAELSRLHVPHRQTKCAVLPLPPETSRSCCGQWISNDYVSRDNCNKTRTNRFTLTSFGCISWQLLHFTLMNQSQRTCTTDASWLMGNTWKKYSNSSEAGIRSVTFSSSALINNARR